MSETVKQRPVYRNIHISEILTYRMPPAALVSILHRISGVVMFVLLPFIIWMFDASVTSEISYGHFVGVFAGGIGFIPGVLIKLVALALIWAFLHHFIAGLRHLWMDMAHAVSKDVGRKSSLVVLGVSIALTLLLGVKLYF